MNDLPLRLADPEGVPPDPADPDVIWTDPAAMPLTLMERMLREVPWLIMMTTVAATARLRVLANNALTRRVRGTAVRQSLGDFSDQTLALGQMEKTRDTDSNLDLIKAPRFGNVPTLTSKNRKDFSSGTNNACLSNVSEPSAFKIARSIFSNARAIIEAARLTPGAAFELVENSFGGDLADTLRTYSAHGKYSVFSHLVQTMTIPVASGSALTRKLYYILHTRPESSKLGQTINSIIAIHRQLAALVPAADRDAVFEAAGKNSLTTIVMLWWPNQTHEVESRFKSLETQSRTEMATAIQAGRVAEAEDIKRSWCPVAALGESLLLTLRHIEPARDLNQTLEPNAPAGPIEKNQFGKAYRNRGVNNLGVGDAHYHPQGATSLLFDPAAAAPAADITGQM